MHMKTALFIDRLVDLQLQSRMAGTNHDIYDRRMTLPTKWPPFDYIPHHIYFYYVRLDTDGKLRVNHYEYNDGPDPNTPVKYAPIPHDKVPQILSDLANKARSGGIIASGDHNFENIKWERRSYVALFVDEVNWAFHRRANGRAAVMFNVNKGSAPNHSFFDAVDLEIEMPIGTTGRRDKRTAVYFVNHMKRNSDGDELQADEHFVFDMYFDVNFADPTSARMTVILDPGGTNQGPPVEP